MGIFNEVILRIKSASNHLLQKILWKPVIKNESTTQSDICIYFVLKPYGLQIMDSSKKLPLSY